MPETIKTPQPPVNVLWSNCNTKEGWSTEDSKAVLSVVPPQGGTCGQIYLDGEQEMFFFSQYPYGVIDCRFVTHIALRFYTDDPDVFKKSTDCSFELSYNSGWASGGVRVFRDALKSAPLHKGWNDLVVPLDFTYQTSECDLTRIQRFRFYAVGLPKGEPYRVGVSDIRFVNESGLRQAERVIVERVEALIDTIGSVHSYSGPDLQRAQGEYNDLPLYLQKKVRNYECLTAAKAMFGQLSQLVLPPKMAEKPLLETGTVMAKLSDAQHRPITLQNAQNPQQIQGDFTAFIVPKGDQPTKICVDAPVDFDGTPVEDLALQLQLYVERANALEGNGGLELSVKGEEGATTISYSIAELGLHSGWNSVYLELFGKGGASLVPQIHQVSGLCLTVFSNFDVPMAVDHIRLIQRVPLQLNEDFIKTESVALWQSNATITHQPQALVLTGTGEVTLTTSAYPLSIFRPDRTPIEFNLLADHPQGVTAIGLQLCDQQGRTVQAELDPEKLQQEEPPRFSVLPQEMRGADDFDFTHIQSVTFAFSLSSTTTLRLSHLTTTLRQGAYWRDWLYDYHPPKGDYAIAVIPDIQELTAIHPEKLDAMINWIVTHKDQENIRFVVDVGDVTWNGHNGSREEYAMARAAFQKLRDAGLTFSLSYGNHDRQRDRNTALLNEFFPLSEAAQSPDFGGEMEAGKVDNLFYRFTVGKTNYLVLAMEMSPRDEVIDWANQVVSQHPEDNVIISVHNYMGNLYGKRSPDGDRLWETLVRRHNNIFMVICGHDSVVADLGSLNFAADQGEQGNLVYQVMVNAQDIDASRGGVGLLLLLRFTNGGETIHFNYFSPVHQDWAYKENNQFFIHLPKGQLLQQP